jgi:hypothetical protein
MLCFHSLASLCDAVKTILGEPKREPPTKPVKEKSYQKESQANSQTVLTGRILASVTLAAKRNIQSLGLYLARE